MRTFIVGLLLAGSLAILTGCGGSSNSKLTYSAFSNAANKICKNVDTQAKAIGGASNTANASSAAAISKLVTISDKAISQLKGLSGPPALETARDQFVAMVKANAAVAEKAATAAKAGNQTDYVADARSLNTTNAATDTAGSKLGAPACATDT